MRYTIILAMYLVVLKTLDLIDKIKRDDSD